MRGIVTGNIMSSVINSNSTPSVPRTSNTINHVGRSAGTFNSAFSGLNINQKSPETVKLPSTDKIKSFNVSLKLLKSPYSNQVIKFKHKTSGVNKKGKAGTMLANTGWIQSFGVYKKVQAKKTSWVELPNSITQLQGYVNFEGDTEKYGIYLAQVEHCYGSDISPAQKARYVKMLMSRDSHNDYNVLYTSPILRDGEVNTNISIGDDEYYHYNGKYLQYYNKDGISVIAPLANFDNDKKGNLITRKFDPSVEYVDKLNQYYSDAMKSTNVYSDKFKKVTNEHVKTICLANIADNIKFFDLNSNDFAAFTSYCGIDNSAIVIKTNDMFSTKEDYDFMVHSFTHELAHAYGFALDGFDSSDEFEKIYKATMEYLKGIEKAKEKEKNIETDNEPSLLRNYAKEDSFEFWAECVSEMYGDPNNTYTDPNGNTWRPEDLKVIDVTIDGKTINLYDYVYDKLN